MQKLLTKHTKILLIISVLCLVFVLFISFSNYNSRHKTSDYEYTKQEILVGNTKILAEVADTADKQQLGLGRRTYLQENSGMLFPYPKKTTPYFWMKDMLIPIDIIWIADQKIVGIEKSVPNLPPDTLDFRLPIYSPPAPIDYVLELNAGFSDMQGIKIGDEISFHQ